MNVLKKISRMKELKDSCNMDINRRVAELLGVLRSPGRFKIETLGDAEIYYDAFRNIHHCFDDYCENSETAITFMMGYGISLISIHDGFMACSKVTFETICMSPDGNDNGISAFNADFQVFDDNPIRAVLIVFILMEECKS